MTPKIASRLIVSSIASAAMLAVLAVPVFAAPNPRDGTAPTTPATTIHGTPQNNPAFDGDACNGADTANPGVRGGCGASDIHNIAGGSPGKDGASAAGGGSPPACTMHGGLGDFTSAPCD